VEKLRDEKGRLWFSSLSNSNNVFYPFIVDSSVHARASVWENLNRKKRNVFIFRSERGKFFTQTAKNQKNLLKMCGICGYLHEFNRVVISLSCRSKFNIRRWDEIMKMLFVEPSKTALCLPFFCSTENFLILFVFRHFLSSRGFALSSERKLLKCFFTLRNWR
jgi:hypothetical protein